MVFVNPVTVAVVAAERPSANTFHVTPRSADHSTT